MHANKLLIGLAAASTAWAQSLTEALGSQNRTLSMLIGILQQQPELLRTLGGASNITVLAPSNDAFTKLLANPAVAAAVQNTPSLVPALLSYHVLNGTFNAAQLTSLKAPAFVPTLLVGNAQYSTVTGGQVVEVKGDQSGVTIVSGNGTTSKVTGTDFNFTGGTVHIIDTVLSIPPNLTTALTEGKLTSLAEAATKANLVQALSGTQQLTLFAPNNEAFAAVASVASGLTIEQLTGVLGYHVINGSVVYSSQITDGLRAKALQGTDLTLTIRDGSVYVNKAKVVKADVLVKNGVVHVIDGVLIPESPSSTSPSGSNPSGTSPSGTSPSPSSPASGSAAPVPAIGATMGKGAAGVAALLGGVAMLINM